MPNIMCIEECLQYCYVRSITEMCDSFTQSKSLFCQFKHEPRRFSILMIKAIINQWNLILWSATGGVYSVLIQRQCGLFHIPSQNICFISTVYRHECVCWVNDVKNSYSPIKAQPNDHLCGLVHLRFTNITVTCGT